MRVVFDQILVPLQLRCKRDIFFCRQGWISVQDMLGVSSGIGKDQAVFCQGGYVQGDRKAALLGAFQISRAAELHVFFGQFESVFGGAQKVQPFLGLLGHFGAFHQYAIRPFRTSADASAQLMQLA